MKAVCIHILCCAVCLVASVQWCFGQDNSAKERRTFRPMAAIWGYHQFILGQKPTVMRVTSVDLLPQAAFSEGTVLFLPRVRGNYGLFSTEVRFSNGKFADAGFTVRRNSFDWQLISFNLLQSASTHLWLGTGFTRNGSENRSWNEHGVGLHVYHPNGRFSFLLEGRYATDYIGLFDKVEGSGSFNWWLLKSAGLDVSIGGGGHWVAWEDRSEFMVLCGLRLNVN